MKPSEYFKNICQHGHAEVWITAADKVGFKWPDMEAAILALLEAVEKADRPLLNAFLYNFEVWLKVATNEDRRQVANILDASVLVKEASRE